MRLPFSCCQTALTAGFLFLCRFCHVPCWLTCTEAKPASPLLNLTHLETGSRAPCLYRLMLLRQRRSLSSFLMYELTVLSGLSTLLQTPSFQLAREQGLVYSNKAFAPWFGHTCLSLWLTMYYHIVLLCINCCLLILAAGFWPLHLRFVALGVLLQRRLCLARFQVFRCSEWIPLWGADVQWTVGWIMLLSFTHLDLSLKRDWSGQSPRLASFYPPLVYF